MMTFSEKIELGLIPCCSAGVWLMASLLPYRLAVGQLMLDVSVLLLLQSLVRDLFLLAKMRRMRQPNPIVAVRCICLESTVGMTGVLVGVGLLGWGGEQTVVMAAWQWSALAVLTMGMGFGIKDYVLETKPWRIRRDADHMNIVVKWNG
jgi:hypothetical protein